MDTRGACAEAQPYINKFSGVDSVCVCFVFVCMCARVCVLKCGELVHLQLTEAQPNLLEIGNNQDETKKLLEEHEQLLAKLKVISTVPMSNKHVFILKPNSCMYSTRQKFGPTYSN